MANTGARTPLIPSFSHPSRLFHRAQLTDANRLPELFPNLAAYDAVYVGRAPLSGPGLDADPRRTFAILDCQQNVLAAFFKSLSGDGSAVGDSTASAEGAFTSVAVNPFTARDERPQIDWDIRRTIAVYDNWQNRTPIVNNNAAGSASGDATASAASSFSQFPFNWGTAATCERPPLDWDIRRTISVLDNWQNRLPFLNPLSAGTAQGDAAASGAGSSIQFPFPAHYDRTADGRILKARFLSVFTSALYDNVQNRLPVLNPRSAGSAQGDATASAVSSVNVFSFAAPLREWEVRAVKANRLQSFTSSILDNIQNRLPILFAPPGPAVGNATGDATASAVGRALAKAAGTAQGDSIASAVAISLAKAAGSAIGGATATSGHRTPTRVIITRESVKRGRTSVGALLGVTSNRPARAMTELAQASQNDAWAQMDWMQTDWVQQAHPGTGRSTTTTRSSPRAKTEVYQ